LGIVGGCGVDPVVALHLKNAADYRLPTFGPHGTKPGHSTYFWTTWHQTRAFLISVNNKSDFSGRFDNSKKGEVSGQIEWMGG